MAVITLSQDSEFTRKFIEMSMMELISPALQFYGMPKGVNLNGATSFKSYDDRKSSEQALKDGDISAPVPLSEEARLPEMGMTEISSRTDDVQEYGFALRFSEKVLENQSLLENQLKILMKNASYAMRRQVNRDVMSTIYNSAGVDPITLNDGSWTTSNKIIEDIRDLQKAFDVVETDFKLTNMYTYSDAYWGVTKFCDALGNDLTPSNLKGVSLGKDDFMREGLIGLDMNAEPLTFYYNNNPKLSTLDESFINVNIVEEKRRPRNTIVEITMEYGIGVNHPTAMLYQPNI